jgi:hypothetical protein
MTLHYFPTAGPTISYVQNFDFFTGLPLFERMGGGVTVDEVRVLEGPAGTERSAEAIDEEPT